MGLDRKDQALDWLDRAYQQKSLWLNTLAVDYRFDGLRSDSRFRALLRKMGLQ